MGADGPPLDEADLALIERVAQRVAGLRLEVPALLTLETARPLSRVAGHALAFFQPFAQALFALPDYERFAALLERPAALDRLVTRIEARAEEARAAARAARTAPPR